ncbi:MAG: hypothetical protein U1D33_02365, partial [bacterium]|nr:hypothetical protein [bacterium]
PDFLDAFAKEIDKYKGDGDTLELHATEMTRVPWCVTSPDTLRRAALGCENVPATGAPMNARAER